MSPQRPRDARAVPSRPGTRVPSHHPSRVRPFVVVAVAALALSLAACGADAGTPASTAGPTTTSTRPGSSVPVGTATSPTTTATGTTSAPTPPVGSDEDQIRATIDTYWKEWVLAQNPPDPERGPFLAVLAGQQRDREIRELQKQVALGQAARLPEPSRFSHVTLRVDVTGDAALALECVVDDLIVFEAATGKVLNDETSTLSLRTSLTREGGLWRISDSRAEQEQEGVHSCVVS